MTKTHQIRGEMLRGCSDLLERLTHGCYKENEIFDSLGTLNTSPDQPIAVDIVFQILEEAAELTGDINFGVALAMQQMKMPRLPYSKMIVSSPSMDSALQVAAEYRDYYSQVTYWDWHIEGKFGFIEKKSYTSINRLDRQHTLYCLASTYGMLRAIMGKQWSAHQISLIRPLSEGVEALEKHFGCQVMHGQDFDGFVIHKTDFYRTNVSNTAPKQLEEAILDLSSKKMIFHEKINFVITVQKHIQRTLTTNLCNLNDISSMLSLSPRALQSQLANEGTTFQELLIDTRMIMAKRLLSQPGVPLTQIAYILGYSELSAFTRAFSKALNCSPRNWRRSNDLMELV